jgi:hypothetical protein
LDRARKGVTRAKHFRKSPALLSALFSTVRCIKSGLRATSQPWVQAGRTRIEQMSSAVQTRTLLDTFGRASKFGSKKNPSRRYRVFSKSELTLHGSLVLSLAADVVVLPLHTDTDIGSMQCPVFNAILSSGNR